MFERASSSKPSASDYIFGLATITLLLGWLLSAILPYLWTFASATWEAWAIFVAGVSARHFLKRGADTGIWSKVAEAILPAIISGSVVLLTLSISFAIFKAYATPTRVSYLEDWLLREQTNLEHLDRMLVYGIPLLAVFLIVMPLSDKLGALRRYIRVKKWAAYTCLIWLTVTSFTFLSYRPLAKIAEWDYREDLRWYKISLRREREAIAGEVAARELIRSLPNLSQPARQQYALYFNSLSAAIANRPDTHLPCVVYGRMCLGRIVRDELSAEVEHELDSMGIEKRRPDLRIFNHYRALAEGSVLTQDEAFSGMSPAEISIFRKPQSDGTERNSRKLQLHAQQLRERTLEGKEDTLRDAVTIVFVEAVGSHLQLPEGLMGEYVKEVISALSERRYDEIVELWYGSHDRSQDAEPSTTISVGLSEHLDDIVDRLHPSDVPIDPRQKDAFTQSINKAIDRRFQDDETAIAAEQKAAHEFEEKEMMDKEGRP
jgi:hypothetical protein